MPEASKQDGDGGEGLRIQDFIFARDLAEVYLLLDNVSTSPDKNLPEPEDGLGSTWIEDVCRIGWPPDSSEDKQAEEAALLIKARDRLNRRAAPATGGTIAFTLLVAGEDDPSEQDSAAMALARRRKGRLPIRGEDAPSRRSLAALAFPGLV